MKHLHRPASAGKSRIAKNANCLQGGNALERGPASDRRYFARFPNRCFYVRLADVAEAALVPPPPPGKMIFVAVRRIAPGLRSRMLFGANDDFQPDRLTEAEAAAWFAFAATGEAR